MNKHAHTKDKKQKQNVISLLYTLLFLIYLFEASLKHVLCETDVHVHNICNAYNTHSMYSSHVMQDNILRGIQLDFDMKFAKTEHFHEKNIFANISP